MTSPWIIRACMMFSMVGLALADEPAKSPARVPIIDVTDLYHPHEDIGDNFDLIAAYALPEIDLRAIVLDITEEKRQPPTGPRDPGFIPVAQLNSLFNRNVPCAVTPYSRMKSPADTMADAPAFQQGGIDLLLNTLRQSSDRVDILSFGSAKAVAAAFNREPELLRSKVRQIHLSAGASSPEFLEWNVELDPNAIVCLLRSDLPIAIYPCATKEGPFAYGPNNAFWRLPNLSFVAEMDPRLRRYLAFAFGKTNRVDFLRAMDEDPPAEILKRIAARQHKVWETAAWIQASNRRLVRRADGHYRILPAAEVLPTDQILPNTLRPCKIEVNDKGLFRFELTDQPTNFQIYDREDAKQNETALCEALPALYRSFTTQREQPKQP